MQAQIANVATQTRVRTVANAPLVKASDGRAVMQLNRVNLRSFLLECGSQIMSVTFTKVGGETRTLTGRRGVTAYLKGGQNNVERGDRAYFTMFDMNLRQYRTVSLDTVSQVRAKGITYNVID